VSAKDELPAKQTRSRIDRLRLLVSIISWPVYIIIFWMLLLPKQDGGILVAIPVIITGYLLGLLPGIVAGMLAFPLNLLLFYITRDPILPEILLFRTIPPIVALAAIGAVAGLFHNLEEELRRQLAERRRIEEKLLVSEEKFRGLVDQSPDGIILADHDGRVIEWNRGQEEITGIKREKALGRFIWNVQYDSISEAAKDHRLYERLRSEVLEFIQTGRAPIVDQMMETEISRPNGSSRVIQLRFFPINLKQDLMAGGVSRDITDVKRAEDLSHRMAMAARLAEASEAERRRLARELHDQVGQNLTALSLNLSMLRSQLTAAECDLPGTLCRVLYDRLDDSLALVSQTMEQVRGVMADLRPPVLDEYGLLAALQWEGARLEGRTGIGVDVVGSETEPRLNLWVETALFRIAQEALTNVVKHAQATHVDVALSTEDDTLRMIVADNGVGFDPQQAREMDGDGGWGLRTMVERAEAIGGSCHVESRPGEGTRVIVQVSRQQYDDPMNMNGAL
jgi:PAS domain S-box-containing protein